MPVRLDLNTPITTSETTTAYRVVVITTDIDSIAMASLPPPPKPYTAPGVVLVRVKDNVGNYLNFQYAEAEAMALILEINTKNFTGTSLHEWMLARLVADGMLPAGTVTGSPDSTVEAANVTLTGQRFAPSVSTPNAEIVTEHVVGSKAMFAPSVVGGAVAVGGATLASTAVLSAPLITQFLVVYVNRAEGFLSAIETEQTSCPTNAFNAVAGNALVVFVSPYAVSGGAGAFGNVTVTDTAGNTFLPISSHYYFRSFFVFYCANIAGHAANVVTAHLSGVAARPFAVVVRQFSGLGAIASVDVGTGTSTAPSTRGPLPIYSPSAVVMAMIATFNNAGITGGTGFDLATNYGPGKYQGNLFADESKIVSVAEAATANCLNGFWQILAIAIDGAGGPGAGGATLYVTTGLRNPTSWLLEPTISQ